MSKKHYVYVPCIKYGHNGGVMETNSKICKMHGTGF